MAAPGNPRASSAPVRTRPEGQEPSGETATRHGGRARRLAVVLLVAILAAAALVPIWAFKYPPFLDYPNHLASSYVLAHVHDPALPFHRWYGAQWGLYPYVGMYVALEALERVLPVEVAGRVLLSLGALGLPLAMWFFLRQASPGQDALALWGVVGVHNIFFLLTYVNFYLALSLVFLGLGCWLKWLGNPRPRGWLLAAISVTALYFTHLVGFAIAGITMAAYLLVSRRPPRQMLLTGAMFVPGALCYLHSARAIEKQASGVVFLDFADKLSNLRGIMHGYSDTLDWITLGALAAMFALAWVGNREFGWNWRWVVVGAVLFALYWALPWAYGDGSDLDVRVLPVLFGILPALARVGRRGWWLAPIAAALFLLRVGDIARHYQAAQPELAGLAGSFEAAADNARVLPIIQAEPDSDALQHSFAHFWAYGVIRRRWFSPYLFELRGLMPLRITHDSYTLDGFWDLDYRETPDWGAIQADYDYVWCYNAPQFRRGLESIGELVYSNRKLRLYRIHPARRPSR